MEPKTIWEIRRLVHEDQGIWLTKEQAVQFMQDTEIVFSGKYQSE